MLVLVMGAGITAVAGLAIMRGSGNPAVSYFAGSGAAGLMAVALLNLVSFAPGESIPRGRLLCHSANVLALAYSVVGVVLLQPSTTLSAVAGGLLVVSTSAAFVALEEGSRRGAAP